MTNQFDPRCKCCTHPARNRIEELVKSGTPYRKIAEIINTEHPQNPIKYKGLSVHKHHMIFFQVPAESIQTVKVESQPTSPSPTVDVQIDDADLAKMDEPNVVSLIDQVLNRLALLEKKRPLTQAEELQKQRYIDFKIRAEQNQLTKVTKEDEEQRTEAKNRALKLIQELRQRGSGVQ